MLVEKLALLFTLVVLARGGQDYRSHPCIRKCDGVSRVCRYDFVADYYFTMEPKCGNCLRGSYWDCLRPGCVPSDGNKRLVYAVNEMMPGPTIEVCQHDRIVVRLRNLLNPETTSIHWHGMHQRATPFMDGVPGITQCGVMPYSNFTYDFEASEGGTHFWHSHSGYQRTNGFFGTLIVHRKTEHHKYLYDVDVHHALLTEWSSTLENDHSAKFHRTFRYFSNRVNSILVNGIGPTLNSRLPGMRFNVTKGLRYRFRVISAASVVCPITVSVDGHRLLLISSDGNDIEPVTVDSFNILNGERYDFVLNANQTIDEYRIRINGQMACKGQKGTYAVLHYIGAPFQSFSVEPAESKGIRAQCVDHSPNITCVNFDGMKSIDRSFNSREPYRTYVMELGGHLKNNDGLSHLVSPYINKIHSTQTATPLLVRYDAEETCNATHRPCKEDEVCDCVHSITVPANQLIELIFFDHNSRREMYHPMHLHGNQFRVVASEKVGDTLPREQFETLRRLKKLKYNFDRPVIKDTVAVPSAGYTIVRFFNDNPGVWLVHCHIQFHADQGMSFSIRTEGTVTIPKNFPACGDF